MTTVTYTPMTYAQIRFAHEGMVPTNLSVHRLRSDGRTGCGDLVRNWYGFPATLMPISDQEAQQLVANGECRGWCTRQGCWPE